MRHIRFIQTLALALFVFAFANANAQGIEKGTLLVGGSLGFSTSSSTNTIKSSGVKDSTQTGSQFQFSFSPKMGYFFAKNFALGLTINFNTASRTTKGEGGKDQTETETQMLAGPFVRYYYFPAEKVGIFGEAEVGVGAGSVGPSSGSKNTVSQFSIGIGPGFTFFANDNVALEAIVKYNMLNNATKFTTNGMDYDSKTTIGTINFLVGFQFYLNR